MARQQITHRGLGAMDDRGLWQRPVRSAARGAVFIGGNEEAVIAGDGAPLVAKLPQAMGVGIQDLSARGVAWGLRQVDAIGDA